MRTDPRHLATRRYDLLIVGGGIHGLFAAYDAASRGLSVALVEQGDFGGALSFNHQRTIHGGLREVGRGRLRKARAQLFERRRWVQMAPHLLHPVPFVLAARGWTTMSRAALAAGLTAYERISRSTQDGVPPGLALPPSRTVGVAEARRLFGELAPRTLAGAAIWHDYQASLPDRLNWLVALAASASGACLANYAMALQPLTSAGRIVGARVRDQMSGAEIDIEAGVTLLAAGAGLGRLGPLFGLDGLPPFVRAMNMLIDRPAPSAALAALGPAGRIFTIVPWQGYALVGTYQSEHAVDPREDDPPSEAVAEMLDQVNATFPGLGMSRGDVRVVHYGVAPAAVIKGRIELRPEPDIVRCASRGAPGLIALVGVKFTGARAAAEQAIDAVSLELGASTRRCVTGLTPLPHGAVAPAEPLRACWQAAGGRPVDADVQHRLLDEYGTEAVDVLDFARRRGLDERLAPDTPVLAGEVGYAVERSAALRLSDVVQRRTTMGATGRPSRVALARAAEIMAAPLAWGPDRVAAEVADTETRYRVP